MLPRDARERMKTPASPEWRPMRMRSPSSAPPVNGLVGSTATTPTFLPAARQAPASSEISVDFPAPGGPVTPTRCAFPTAPESAASSAAAARGSFSTTVSARASAGMSPERTEAARAEASRTAGSDFQNASRDDEVLDLRRALVDLGDARVAEVALDGELARVAGPAMDLH